MAKKQDTAKKEDKKDQEKQDSTDAKVRELTELVQRVQADFENYKKRSEDDKQRICTFALEDFFLKLLPIIDHLELALKNKDNHDEFAKGVELIYSQFLDVLEKEGIEPIKAVGKKFDPYLHEALMTEESDKDKDEIIEEFQKGYLLKDKVLRHTKVKVSKGAKNG